MMRLPKMEHISPSTGEEVCALLDRHRAEAKVLAGGTDLLVACKLHNIKPAILISLKKIEEWKGMTIHEKGELEIGAMTTLNEVRYHPYVMKHYPALSQAAATVGTTQLREMGTIGGNLCLDTRCIYYNQSESWRKSRSICFKMGGDLCHVIPKGRKCFANFSGDMAPALISLNAEIKLLSRSGQRVIPLEDLYSGNGKDPLTLKPDEVLTEIILPPPMNRQSSAYLKYRMRGAICFPLVGVAVSLHMETDGRCKDCRVVLTALGPKPIVVPQINIFLNGKTLTTELIEESGEKVTHSGNPIPNTSGSTPAYRRRMAGILTRRALLSVYKNLGLIL